MKIISSGAERNDLTTYTVENVELDTAVVTLAAGNADFLGVNALSQKQSQLG